MVPIDILYKTLYWSAVGRILNDFRNKARYWTKNANFWYLRVFTLHDPLQPLRTFAQNFSTHCQSP